MDSKPRRLPFTISSSSSLSSPSPLSSSSALSASRLYGRGSVLGSDRFGRGGAGKLDSDYQVLSPCAMPQVKCFVPGTLRNMTLWLGRPWFCNKHTLLGETCSTWFPCSNTLVPTHLLTVKFSERVLRGATKLCWTLFLQNWILTP